MLDIEFKDVIAAYLKGSGMSDRQLGELALGDPGFVADLNRDHSPRLDTADRVLQFLGMAPIGPRFRREVEAFLTITRCKPAALGTKAAGDSSFVRELRSGASPALASVDRVRSWMHRFANESDRTAIAWLLAHDDAATPSGLDAVFASWTDATAVQKLDETTFLTVPEAAAFLEMSRKTLDGYRVVGGGAGVPQVREPGGVRALRPRGVGEGKAPTADLHCRLTAPGPSP